MTYASRLIDRQIEEALETLGAVVIEGPRGCGKTSTALQYSKSAVHFDTDINSRELAALTPEVILDGDSPRLLDEWQLVPHLWNHVRQTVDTRQKRGQFILTGSAMAEPDATRHPGVMRFFRLRMRPMSLFESGASDGTVSLRCLLQEGFAKAAMASHTFEDTIQWLCVGGWPVLREVPIKRALTVNRGYLSDLTDADFSAVHQVKNRDRVLRLVKSLARHVGTEASLTRIASDVSGGDGEVVRPETISAYIDALERLIVIERVRPWSGHLRSRAVLRKSEKRYFVDPSLGVAALNGSRERLLSDLKTTGFLFENLVIRDLLVYSDSLDASLSHYRDSDSREVDVIVSAPGGQHLAIEIKLGNVSVEQAAKNLLRFRDNLADPEERNSMHLAVITSGTASYQRKDGVNVVSIAHLGP